MAKATLFLCKFTIKSVKKLFILCFKKMQKNGIIDVIDDKNIINENLSKKIKKWRISKNLTQNELANKTGIKLKTLQKYESNEKNIIKASYETVMTLKNALGQE